MNRIDRLFGIVTLLQSRKFVPAEMLAEKFGISVRTVYRDIRALAEQGIPVSFEQGKGYFIVQGYFLRPVSFNPEEANSMLLLETIVAGFTDKSVQANYTRAMDKIRAVMPSEHVERLDRLKEHIRLQLPGHFTSSSDHLAALQDAVSSGNTIGILYRNNNDEQSFREVDPLGIIFYAMSWHMVGWCHLRSDYRDFKLSRIISLEITGNTFTRENHPPLNEFMKRLPVKY